MKKLLLFVGMGLLFSQYSEIKPFLDVADTNLVPDQCDGQWCSFVELAPKLKEQYKSCYYFAEQNEIKCTEHTGKITIIKVSPSNNPLEFSKDYIGTYQEKRGDQLIKYYLYKQSEQNNRKHKR